MRWALRSRPNGALGPELRAGNGNTPGSVGVTVVQRLLSELSLRLHRLHLLPVQPSDKAGNSPKSLDKLLPDSPLIPWIRNTLLATARWKEPAKTMPHSQCLAVEIHLLWNENKQGETSSTRVSMEISQAAPLLWRCHAGKLCSYWFLQCY